ncbi:MAG: hypothetical protein HOO96_31410 [Polyangiaceae bacterium]|nr:hypothetical protein [Polyangiaceae bacterium]
MSTAHFSLEMRSGGSTGGSTQKDDSPKELPAPMDVRVSDYIADAMLGRGDGPKSAPRFRIYWPQAKRDAALPAVRTWVQGLK